MNFTINIIEKSEKYEALAYLKRDWRRELDVIRKCIDCYVLWTEKDEDEDYFTFVCTKPHLLVFVKDSKESSLWPAKVTCVNNDGMTVSVECFGDHLQAEYPFEQCYLYSDTHIAAMNKSALKEKCAGQEKYNRSVQVDLSPKVCPIFYSKRFSFCNCRKSRSISRTSRKNLVDSFHQ